MAIHPLVLAGAVSAFVLVLTLAWASQMFYDKRARLQRVRTATGKRQGRVVTATGLKPQKNTQLQQGALAFMKASTKGLSIVKGRQVNEIRKLLVSGGFRSRDAIVVYTFFKLVSPLIFLAAAALIGSKVPDIFIKNVRSKRLESIRKALPDALDMLVICAEAGLSSDASMKRVVAETSRKSSVLGDELNQTALELSFMPERRQALENLAERAPLPSVNAFCNTMIQAEKYGTPLARAFKVLSQEQRNERMMRAEEKAGRLPATMTVPMMIFILPALFIVLIGPAVLDILDNFINMNK